MKKRMLSSLLASLALCGGMVAHAYPTIYGPTGLVAVPTAGLIPSGQVDMTVGLYNSDFGAHDGGRAIPTSVVLNVAKRAEVGYSYDFLTGSSANTWNLHAKYATSTMDMGHFSWSVGAQYSHIGATEAAAQDATAYQLYVVGSRVLNEGDDETPPAFLTAGLSLTEFDGGHGASGSAVRPFAGMRFLLANGTTVSAEVSSKAPGIGDQKPLASFVVRYPMKNNMTVEAGLTNAISGFRTGADHNLFVSVNYRFGQPKSRDIYIAPDGGRLPVYRTNKAGIGEVFVDGESMQVPVGEEDK